MPSQTIDFHGFPPDVSQEWLERRLNLERDRLLQSYQFSLYAEQRDFYEKYFSDLFLETNKALIQDLDQFIDESLYGSQDCLFPHFNSNLIFPASVNLGFQYNDYLPTIQFMEDHIRSKYKSVRILSIESKMNNKKTLLNMLEEAEGSKHLLVLIQRTETVEKLLIESFINILYGKLIKGSAERVLVLFCTSCGWISKFELILPTAVSNRMRKITPIVKDLPDVTEIMQKKLSENDKVKFGPKMIDLLNDILREKDPSIMNVKYLYEYSIFEHYMNVPSLFTLDSKVLTNLFKSHPSLIDTLKNLKSISSLVAIEEINWKDPRLLAKFCRKKIKALHVNHAFLWEQIQSYFILIKDTGQDFPDTVEDIYTELFWFEELGHSHIFYDALTRIHKFSYESIICRIENIVEKYHKLDCAMKAGPDICRILIEYKEKLENNDDPEVRLELRMGLVNRLLKHAQLLKNPRRAMPLNEAVYNYDPLTIRKRVLPSTRIDALPMYIDKKNLCGVLYNIIHESGASELSYHDLFDDFKQIVEEMKLKERVESESTTKKLKSTNRRSTRISRSVVAQSTDKNKTEFFDQGLLKAIFIDLMSCLVRQGFIGIETRKSKRGLVKRFAWL